MKRSFFAVLCLLSIVAGAKGQQTYQKPPQDILDVLNAPRLPTCFLSPDCARMVLAQPVNYPSISDLAEPMLPLAGVRINPATNMTRDYLFYWTGLKEKDLKTGTEIKVTLPAAANRLGRVLWNADGTMFAFTNEASDRVELWVAEAATAKAFRVEGVRLNPMLESEVQWMPDQRSLLVKMIPAGRGAMPEAPVVPPGPRILESSGVTAASSTYEAGDLLQTPYDADLFDHYAASQLAMVRLPSCQIVPLGQPAAYGEIKPSPDGKFLLVERYHRPYSYLRGYYRFPREIELWSSEGKIIDTLASIPLSEQVPVDGEIPGPRDHFWRATAPATILWAEALDGGDPAVKAPYRDRVMQLPVGGKVSELCRTEHRFSGLEWIEDSQLFLVAEYDRDRRWVRTWLRDAGDPSAAPRLLRDHSLHEKFRKPGTPLSRTLANGARAVRRQGNRIYLSGEGFIPNGQRPFLDRLDLGTWKSERLFRSGSDCYETFIDWVDPVRGTFITRRESKSRPPNFFLRTLAENPLKDAADGDASWGSASRALTEFPDPQPQLRKVTKQIVTYQRADSLPLSFTLYLPPGYRKGRHLPTVVWAYPGDIADRQVAGQVSGSDQRFSLVRGPDPLFFALAGYAVLDNAAMPVVGPPASSYDGFIDQICANARAAVDKAVEMGVTDPDRVGVGGHSHGGHIIGLKNL
jgi:dipeptidyl aminopeptidase/acylaminoacyl peptidase